MSGYPTWVVMLRRERMIYGQPTLREMSNWTDIPFQMLGNWFNGGSLPEVERLRRLLASLGSDQKVIEEIELEVKQAHVEPLETPPGRSASDEIFVGTAAAAARITQLRARPGAEARSEKIRAEMTAEVPGLEVVELTEAIRELTALLREIQLPKPDHR